MYKVCISIMLSSCAFGQPLMQWDKEKIEVNKDNELSIVMGADAIIDESWDVLPQPQFWKSIMTLAPDSCLVNIASSRQVVAKMSIADWHKQSEAQKSLFKDSVRAHYQLDSGATIYVTTGKNDFYKFREVYPSLSKGVEAFEANNVDPWYAQAILLIESPAQLKKSSAGAYGAFQLMPGVARAQGLTVNRSVDERKDFYKSAMGASRLIDRICIPEAKRILDQQGYSYHEDDLWFRLFVLHVYHAGSMNVKAVVEKIGKVESGQELIKAMWQNSAASFGNNSQNYTQLALAAQLILHEMIYNECQSVYRCSASL